MVKELLYFGKSNKADKRFKVIFNLDGRKKTIHFGQDGANTYIDGVSPNVRDNYIARHKVRENWDKISAGQLSRYIIWGDSRWVNKNVDAYLKKFNIVDKREK